MASIAITLNTYSHVLPNMQDSAVDAMEAALGTVSQADPLSGCSKRAGKHIPALSLGRRFTCKVPLS
jgi:hypothetical protein